MLGNTYFFYTKACTRVVYKGPNNYTITARSMDWKTEIDPNIWIFPRGMSRSGEVGKNSIQWKSKYGSVITTAWDISTTDGLNEKGLAANILWLAESKYPDFKLNGKVKGLTIAAWAQYVLDNFATVSEAVADFKKKKFVVVSSNLPNSERFATLHLSISDRTGDNAIFEYLNGNLVIHHSKKYNVMTNSPTFEEQLAIMKYWNGIPGTIALPGTNKAVDRFVRASYYVDAIPNTLDERIAVASMFSVIRNCSVPYGISSDTEPNISSTRWRTVSDHENLKYYFESVLTPNTFWIDLKSIDFSTNQKTKKLALDTNKTYCGEANLSFEEALPFKFLGL
nr:linear amide C-N hydrolase [uncultured Flavobacterium sp.]